MNESEFTEAFERCTLPNDRFHHRDHIRLAWIYLRDLPLLEALGRFTTSLKRFATANGHPELYHETITWAYLLLIHERMQRNSARDFESFAKENADLFAWKPSILDRYYDRVTLDSELARRTFVMPSEGGSGVGSRVSEQPKLPASVLGSSGVGSGGSGESDLQLTHSLQTDNR
ncbi:MAG TPA: hypothetical protein VNN08_18000 [Thermoanaerobaculia bacterium]|nr:hypothetical protein [Thermoanaerobaculia bacterium]